MAKATHLVIRSKSRTWSLPHHCQDNTLIWQAGPSLHLRHCRFGGDLEPLSTAQEGSDQEQNQHGSQTWHDSGGVFRGTRMLFIGCLRANHLETNKCSGCVLEVLSNADNMVVVFIAIWCGKTYIRAVMFPNKCVKVQGLCHNHVSHKVALSPGRVLGACPGAA